MIDSSLQFVIMYIPWYLCKKTLEIHKRHIYITDKKLVLFGYVKRC